MTNASVLGGDRREHADVVEREVRAAPQEEAATDLDARSEVAAVAGRAAHPVRGDHDVRVELLRGPSRAELEAYTGLLRVPLQHREKLGPRDAHQPVVVAHPRRPAVDDHRHVVPVSGARHVAQGVRVGRLQLPLGSGGQPDTEPERRVRLSLLIHDHLARRMRQLQQARGIKASWAPAEHRDSP